MTTGDLCHKVTPYLVVDLFRYLWRYLQYFIKLVMHWLNFMKMKSFSRCFLHMPCNVKAVGSPTAFFVF